MFAKHVVQSLKIGIGASGDFFSMEALQEEFKHIDVGEEGGDGVISKAVNIQQLIYRALFYLITDQQNILTSWTFYFLS